MDDASKRGTVWTAWIVGAIVGLVAGLIGAAIGQQWDFAIGGFVIGLCVGDAVGIVLYRRMCTS